MITKIRTKTEYQKAMQLIEAYLAKATQNGGFNTLSQAEAEELKQLSLLAETWEDNISVMPIQQPQT